MTMEMVSCDKLNTRLLPMKIVMFGWFGASACATPFMSVHMKELGLTVKETAIIYTLLPITQTLSSPIAGLIADRLGKYRDVLLVSIVMTIIIATAMLYVPTIKEEHSVKIEINFSILCNGDIAISNCDSIPKSSSINVSICELKCKETPLLNSSWILAPIQLTENSSYCEFESLLHDNFNYSNIINDSCTSVSQTLSSNCSIICSSELNNTFPLINESEDRYLTFYLYLILRVVYNIFSAIGFTLVNSSALALTETEKGAGEYGRQRLWAILAMAIFPPLAGVLVDVFNTGDNLINYAPAFHTHNLLSLLTAVAVWYLDFEMEDAPESYLETFKNFWLIIRSPTILFLLLVVFWLGTMWGFFESFVFWFLKELGSPTYLLGLTVTVGSIVGLPFLYYAKLIVSKVGYANILSSAVIMYMVRCIGLSYLKDPWWIMPFETLEIFTYHLMWVAAATYAVHLSPPGLLATIQGFIEGVHFGVGQGSGSLIGGVLMSDFGSRQAFRIMGTISAAIGVTYSALHYFWLRKEKVKPPSRRASIKSFSSHRNGRKESTLSAHNASEAQRMAPRVRSISIQETPQ